MLVRLLVPVQLFTFPIAGIWGLTEICAEKNVTDAPFAPTADGVLGLPASDVAPVNIPVFPDPPDVPDPPPRI